MRRLGEVPRHVADGPRVSIDLATIRYEDGGEDEYYQLPLAFYPEPQSRLEHAFVGSWADEDFGTSYVYDAVHDREAMACWLRSFADPPAGGPLAFHRLPGHELDLEAHSTLFSGEQSNSSVAFGEDALMKVFRKITPGVNPDIAIHDVLTRAGSDHVAALYGWLECPAACGGRATAATPCCSSPCSSSSCAPPPTAGTWRSRASATSSPRPTCTPTRSAVTSPARPPVWARPWPRPTGRWPSTSPSRSARTMPSAPWRPR
ncbi:maltokinase N-terminal cap-like domain-containing protein [Nocardioides ungokensis]|uniref:maltokinase N-terminal cap-like domain-containing protein n=1 Tax=Nocardioides ungokensis TaxID=1643322 RepID=UPI001FEB081B|nr:hypothetical protein [Nocardioides ungokensis]